MKTFIISLALSSLFIFNLNAQESIKREWKYGELPFNEFVVKTEELYQIRFFYREEWVSDIKARIPNGVYTISELLDILFTGSSLYYYIDASGNVIITSNFAIKVNSRQSTTDSIFIPPEDIYESSSQDKASGNVFYNIGNPAEKNLSGKAEVSGYITDMVTKDPVSGVTVYVAKIGAGTVSNEHGFYSLTIPRGSYLVQLSFIGMKEKQVNINLYGSGEMNVDMNRTLIPLQETVISAQKNVIFRRYESGVEKLNITSFKLLPASLGENDIFKSIMLIPGVKSVGEGSTGFNVRGGSTDQNLILLYGSPIYNASHFFGFFSVVNSDIIKDVTLYKGGIPARYGGRISSVLDISAKEGNRKEFTGNAGLSPVTTHLTLEGPLIKDTLTFMLTGRTTYSNWLLRTLDNPAIKNSKASFNDLNGKLTYDPDRNNKFDLSAYHSNDVFSLNSDTTYNYNNSIIALKWRHFFSSRFLSMMELNNSNYKYDISGKSATTEGFLLSHSINSTGFKTDFSWFAGRHEFNFGTNFTGYSVLPGKYLPSNDSSLVTADMIPKEKALESALYFDDKFALTDYLSVNAGIRLSSFFTFGPDTVLIYDPEYSRSPSTVTDTLVVNSNHIKKSYAGPEFRLSLNFRLSPESSLKINFNKTRQYLHLLSNSTSISPTDTWKLCDYYLKPQSGIQYSMGYYHLLPKGIDASAEVYYKDIKNMIDYKGGTNLIMNGTVEKDLVNVKGKAYGIELMVKKTEGRIRWSLAYTYARTLVKSTGKFSDEIINSGEWFPASFDKPNDLTTTFSYIFSRRLSFSGNYTWSTGRPITYPVATYHLQDLILIHYSERNKYRIPDYSRLDLSVRVNGSLKTRKIGHPNWTISVYNILGRANVYSVYFKNENNTIKGYKLSIFAQAIPSVTYSFDF